MSAAVGEVVGGYGVGRDGSRHQRSGGSGPAPYLEQDRKGVTSDTCVEVRSCGCKSWFCKSCCLSKGIRLKERLAPELAKFTGLMMLTFTVDPELFSGPEDGFDYVKRKRCIAIAMQRLRRAGLVHSGRYLAVVEWQKNGWPHWHVLVDATHIPFDKLCDAWNRNWKGWRERVKLGRPGFGSVRFSNPRLNRSHAAGYVTAYLTKFPEHGYPDWVWQSGVRQVRRFEASRGFWPSSGHAVCDDDETEDESDEQESGDESGAEPEEAQPMRSIHQLVESCGSRCVVLGVRSSVDPDTGELKFDRRFVAMVHADLGTVLVAVGVKPDELNSRGTVASFVDGSAVLRYVRGVVGGSAGRWYTGSQGAIPP